MKKVLALAIVVLLLAAMAAPMALAADDVVITPNATYNGETVTMTANGVDEQIAIFDLGSVGFGTGIEYGFWFEHSGSFSFDKDVTLIFQGQPKFELKAGEVYQIAGDNYSECYAQLDDGNMIAILDKDNPGNWASLPPASPMSAMPATINGERSEGAAPAAPAGPAGGGFGAPAGGGFGAPSGPFVPGDPAPGIETGAPITVYITVSADGVLKVAAQPIQVTTYSVEAVIVAAHEQFYSEGLMGFNAGTNNSYGMYMIDKFWGIATTPYVIKNSAPLGSGANAEYISADAAPVAPGDNIIVVADTNGATPPISLEYDKETQIVKVNQWALDFTTFQYTNAAVENVDIVDAETGAVLGTTNALGNARLSKMPACGVAAYPGVSAVAVSDSVKSFTPIQDKYVPPAHDYSIFGGPDGRSLLRILVIGLGLIIPLLIVVLFAYNRELRTAGVKYEDLRGDTEVTRRL